MADSKEGTLRSYRERSSSRLSEAPAVKLENLRIQLRKPANDHLSVRDKADQLGIAPTSYFKYVCYLSSNITMRFTPTVLMQMFVCCDHAALLWPVLTTFP